MTNFGKFFLTPENFNKLEHFWQILADFWQILANFKNQIHMQSCKPLCLTPYAGYKNINILGWLGIKPQPPRSWCKHYTDPNPT